MYHEYKFFHLTEKNIKPQEERWLVLGLHGLLVSTPGAGLQKHLIPIVPSQHTRFLGVYAGHWVVSRGGGWC